MDAQRDGQPAHIVFVTASLGAGGAERILTWLAGRFAAAGRRVTILRLEAPERAVFYPLHPSIQLISLDLSGDSASLPGALRANFRRLRRLRGAFRQLAPDRIVGMGTETCVLSLLAGFGTWPVIVAERCDPNFYPASRIWRWLRDRTYPWARAVVCQTDAARRALSGRLRSRVIPNPVARPGATQPPPAKVDLVAMGRLTRQKGFDVLIEALARLPARHAAVRLRILGEGEARATLQAQAQALGVAARIDMPGLVAEPGPWLRAAKLFVLPSRYEGFPNALCEAMALGLPAVATDCPSGPAEILRDTVDGLLVPPGDAPALADALARLLDDDALRAAMGARAAEIVERFAEDAVFDRWREAIEGPRDPRN